MTPSTSWSKPTSSTPRSTCPPTWCNRPASRPSVTFCGQRDEPERHIMGNGQFEAGHLRAVDVHELAPQRRCGIQRFSQQALLLPQLQRARLDADRLGVRRGIRQPVDDPALHAASPKLDGDRQPDRSCPDDEHIAGHQPHLRPIGTVDHPPCQHPYRVHNGQVAVINDRVEWTTPAHVLNISARSARTACTNPRSSNEHEPGRGQRQQDRHDAERGGQRRRVRERPDGQGREQHGERRHPHSSPAAPSPPGPARARPSPRSPSGTGCRARPRAATSRPAPARAPSTATGPRTPRRPRRARTRAAAPESNRRASLLPSVRPTTTPPK